MNPRIGRFWRWMILISASGALFQTAGVGFTRTGIGSNCQGFNFLSNGVLTSVDFCYILDCQNGFLGGAVQPCANSNGTGNSLLLDCSTATINTTTTTNTNTTNQGT